MLIQRYLIRETAATLFGVVLVLYLIYLSNRFVRYLAEAASGAIPADTVAGLLALKTVTALPVLLPLALFLAVLLAMGRLYKDSEITAMVACGIGYRQLFAAVFKLASGVALAVLFIAVYVAPWAQRQALALKEEARSSADFTAIASGRFRQIREGELIFYAREISVDRSVMSGVFAQQFVEGQRRVLVAERAFQRVDERTGDRFLVFQNGARYDGLPLTGEMAVMTFSEHGLRISKPGREAGSVRLAARSTASLWGTVDPAEAAELQWRLAMPVSAVLMALIAVLLSRSDPRQGRFAKLFTGILIYVIYNNLLGVSRSWVEQGTVPIAVGIWWVHGVLLLVFVVMLVHRLGWRWLWAEWRSRRA